MTSRRWCFTINNYTDDDIAKIVFFCEDQNVKFCIIGFETGNQGTPHVQGYVNAGRPVRLHWLRQHLLPTCHFESARGSESQNIAYCSKDGDTWSFGSPGHQGDRSDVRRIVESIVAGTSYEEICALHTYDFIKYHRGIREAIRCLFPTEPRSWKTITVVYWGTPGTGKSKTANELATAYNRPTYYKPRGEWWDGYTGQSAVVIDDFYGWIKYDELLKITDRYPYQVPIKGGYVQFTSHVIFITSNKPPNEWYTFQNFDPSALLRRIDELHEFTTEL